MTARYAVYFAPAEHSPLWQIGSTWLGRDARTGMTLPQPAVDAISADRVQALTASPRLYGLHATLKPPFRLASAMTGQMLNDAARTLASRYTAFNLPALQVDTLSGFIALRTMHDSEALQRLADACVVELDRFRHRADAGELTKRRASGLTQRQDALLSQYGYPYVMDQWRFHITLTERVAGNERDLLLARLRRYFEEALAAPVRCEDLCLFVQPKPGADFVLRERFGLSQR